MNHDLLSRVLEPANLASAWKQVRSNKGAPGIDGVTIEAYPDSAKQHWPSVRQALLDGTYQPSPVRRHVIGKPDGGERLLGIPTVMDRVIQQAIVQVLTPVFDPGDQSSLGCLNATSVTQTGAIYPGLDGVFPVIGILLTNSPAGSMDTSANPLLLSEAMAQAENPFQESGQVRR